MEQRKYNRLYKKVITWYSTDTQNYLGALTRNISRGGLLIEVKQKVLIDSVIYLEMKLPGNRNIMKMSARVVRTEDLTNGNILLGLEYVSINDNDLNNINEYVKDNL